MIVGQNDMGDGFVGDLSYFFDDLVSQTRGGLGLDNHNRGVADDHSGVWVTFGSKCPQILAHLRE